MVDTLFKIMLMAMTNETKQILYRWFDMKYDTYDKLERDGSIYLYEKNKKYIDIVIIKEKKMLHFNPDIYDEWCEMIPTGRDDFARFLSEWVEDTFHFNGFISLARYMTQILYL